MEKILSAKRPTTENGRMYHVRVSSEEVGKYVILAGDPERIKVIADQLDKPYKVSEHREFTIYNGFVEKELVTACSTGIGGPATTIAMEELAFCGAKSFIRIGSCGAIQEHIKPGDLIIANAAVRLDGASKAYIFPEYPAVASYNILHTLLQAAKNSGCRYHMGLVASTDSFYVGQSRPGVNDYLPYRAAELINILRRTNTLCFEMETATLFTLANVYGLQSGCILAVFANRITNEFEKKGELNAAKVCVEAIRGLVRERGKEKSLQKE